jgi:hypothetical protein
MLLSADPDTTIYLVKQESGFIAEDDVTNDLVASGDGF